MKSRLAVVVASAFSTAILALAWGGCGGGSGSDSSDDVETLVLVPDAGASVLVTPQTGGTVTSRDGVLTVIVPPGAVAEDTEITIRRLHAEDDPDSFGYELLPHGQMFEVPVTLERRAPAPLPPDDEDESVGGLSIVMSVDGTLETPEQASSLDPVTFEWVTSWQQSHFSIVLDGRVKSLDVSWTGGPNTEGRPFDPNHPFEDVCVGAEFEIVVSLSLASRAKVFNALLGGPRGFVPDWEPTMVELNRLSIQATGSLFSEGAVPAEPVSFGDVTVPSTRRSEVIEGVLPSQTPHEFRVSFECREPGLGTWNIYAQGPARGTLSGDLPSSKIEDGGGASPRILASIDESDNLDLLARATGFVRVRRFIECVPCDDDDPATICEEEPVDLDDADQAVADAAIDIAAAAALVCADASATELSGTNAGVDPGLGDHVQFEATASQTTTLDAAIRLPEGTSVARGPRPLLGTGATFAAECGPLGDGVVVCADPGSTLESGEVYVLSSILQGPVPLADPVNHYQYGFVFDGDGDETNNYFPPPAFRHDTFQNTDQWYQLLYEPQSGWTLEVIGATNGELVPLASRARVVIVGDAMVLLVPFDELPSADPLHRFTAFRHLGDFGLEPPFDANIDAEPRVTVGLRSFDGTDVPPPPLSCLNNQAVTMGLSADPLPNDTRRFAAICPPSFSGGPLPDCPELLSGTCVNVTADATFRLEDGVYTVSAAPGWTIVSSSHGTEDPALPTPNRSSLPEQTEVTLSLTGPDGEATLRFSLEGESVFVADYDPPYAHN